MNVSQAALLARLFANARENGHPLDVERLARVATEVHHGEGMPARRGVPEAIGKETLRRPPVPRLPAATAMASFQGHLQQDPPAAATLHQPSLLPQAPQALHQLHPLLALEAAILRSVHLPDREVVVAAVSHTTHRATSLAHLAVVHGSLVHAVVAASGVVSMTALPLVHAVLSAEQHLIRLLSAAPATRLRRRTHARCASAII